MSSEVEALSGIAEVAAIRTLAIRAGVVKSERIGGSEDFEFTPVWGAWLALCRSEYRGGLGDQITGGL